MNRLEQTTLDMKLVQGEESAQTKESAQTEESAQETKMSAPDKPEEVVLSRTEAQELESLLKEFLV